MLQLQKRGRGIVKCSRSHKTASGSSEEWRQLLTDVPSTPSAHVHLPAMLVHIFRYLGMLKNPRRWVPDRHHMN